MMKGAEITEGQTRLIVPEDRSRHGPGKITGSVFFNEQMALNRDVSVMLLRTLDRDLRVADAMTATGSRAVRIANEVPRTEVTANDRNPAAMEYVEANIELNRLENCRASNRDMHVLFSEETFDYVDIDPFGSPAPFTQSAVRGCRRRGILAVTATDTAPLAGANRAKCERRYLSRPLRGPMCHEMGLRILMGFVARELARYDRGMVPLLSFSADHYYRTYVQITEGAEAADRTLDSMIHIAYDPATLERSASRERDGAHVHGPMWGGALHDRSTLAGMDAEGMAEERRASRILELWRREYDRIPYTYDVSELSSHTKLSPPRMEDLLEALREHGSASRTHTSPTSFKTDLELRDILSVYRETSPQSGNRAL
ncbi:MAG: tRNA (guanine(26)-N(2))-dimethyltransferase [Candidatus Methanomethylophilaceae archaeon]|jgi:tRNA (guanine26-N2/guanine27-N2)-dimethyltransferase|nr:tRNA (guanine(26)-N(2))-dimethyltransferase [Candidatus Methanomethylophilaceae archaeon]